MMAHSAANSRRPLDEASGGASSLESVRALLAERLRERRSEIEETIFARVREIGLDSAVGEDAEYVSGLGATVAEAVDYGLRSIEQDEDWLGSIPLAAVVQARRSARHGVSLQTVLHRYNAGQALLADFIMQEAEHIDLSSQGIALRQVLRTQGALLLDHFTASIASEYQHEVERAAHSPELRRMERVQRLLAGGSVDAAALGYELDAWHLALIAMGAMAEETVRRLAAGLDRQLLSVSRSEETVWAWFGGQRRLAIADLERPLSVKEAAGVSLAIGEPGRGIDGWRLTHRQAQAAILIALHRPQRLTRYADVALLAAVLRDKELATSLVEIHLSPLQDERDGGAVSRETLRAYFAAGCNTATAAAALGVDRHTVQRRLHAIEERLGRLLNTCQPELEVALRLEELGGATRLFGGSQPPAL